MNPTNKNRQTAFTLIETLLAVTLITVVITAVTGLILSTILAGQRNANSMKAAYLAQESLEAVRFMRDSNWRQNYSWNGGRELWNADFSVSDSDGLHYYLADENSNCPPCFGFSTIESDGIVTVGNQDFTREVFFKLVQDDTDATAFLNDTLEVTSLITWQERGKNRSVEVSTYLTNWQ